MRWVYCAMTHSLCQRAKCIDEMDHTRVMCPRVYVDPDGVKKLRPITAESEAKKKATQYEKSRRVSRAAKPKKAAKPAGGLFGPR